MDRILTVNEDSHVNGSQNGSFLFFKDCGGQTDSFIPGEFINAFFNVQPDVEYIFTFKAGNSFKQEFSGKGFNFFRFQAPAGFDEFFAEFFVPATGFKETRRFSGDGFFLKAS